MVVIKKRKLIKWPHDRISNYTDSVFAFAVTLLVLNLINISVPSGNQSFIPLLLHNAPAFISFALTFIIISRFWMSHTRLFAIIKEPDTTVVRLNNALLFFITAFPFVASIFGSHINNKDAVIMYAGCFALVGFIQYAMGKHAYKQQLFISEDLNDNFLKIFVFYSLSTPTVFLASILVAFFSPLLAEILWVVILFLKFGFKFYFKHNPSDEIEIDEL